MPLECNYSLLQKEQSFKLQAGSRLGERQRRLFFRICILRKRWTQNYGEWQCFLCLKTKQKISDFFFLASLVICHSKAMHLPLNGKKGVNHLKPQDTEEQYWLCVCACIPLCQAEKSKELHYQVYFSMDQRGQEIYGVSVIFIYWIYYRALSQPLAV